MDQGEPEYELVPANIEQELWCKGVWDEDDQEFDWSLDPHDDAPSGKKINLKLDYKKGPYRIKINLVILASNKPVVFDISNPINIDELGNPPDKGVNTTQISALACTNNTLILYNENKGKKRDLYYQINFLGANPCDPMFKNGGGR